VLSAFSKLMFTGMEVELAGCNVMADETEAWFIGSEKESLMTGVNPTSL
jgi:hypothetical protein